MITYKPYHSIENTQEKYVQEGNDKPLTNELFDLDLTDEFKRWFRIVLNLFNDDIFLSEVLFTYMKVYFEPDSYKSRNIGTLANHMISRILESGQFLYF